MGSSQTLLSRETSGGQRGLDVLQASVEMLPQHHIIKLHAASLWGFRDFLLGSAARTLLAAGSPVMTLMSELRSARALSSRLAAPVWSHAGSSLAETLGPRWAFRAF